jgi:hypothetical protein
VPRIAGLLAAGLLATNGPHVVVNSHIAWSNCLTPLLTTLAFWALLRAGEARPFLPLAGLLLGLALQTHPLVVAMLPGLALAVLLHDARSLRTPWPWLAAAAFLVVQRCGQRTTNASSDRPTTNSRSSRTPDRAGRTKATDWWDAGVGGLATVVM